MDPPTCPFCNDGEAVLSNELAIARWDVNPVAPGHILIVTRHHIANFFETTADEGQAPLALLQEAKELPQREHRPDGFNVGINIGEVAGQTIPHVHIHLIPRYRGDTPQPRGGVRGVIPAKQSYRSKAEGGPHARHLPQVLRPGESPPPRHPRL